MKILTTLSLGILFSLTACQTDKKQEESAPMAMNMTPNLQTVKLAKIRPIVNLKLSGELVADRETALYAKVNSFVSQLKVDIGSKVKKGDLLIGLEAPEIQSQVASARSKWTSAAALYTATVATYKRIYQANQTPGAIAADALDQITAKKESDFAQLQAAQSVYQEVLAMQNYLSIRAPFDGIVTERNIDVGAYVGPMGKGADKPMLVIQDLSKLRLAVSVAESHAPYVHLGDTLKFTIRSLPQKQFSATVSRKSESLDNKLRSERVEADLINTASDLKPLMVAEVNLGLQSPEASFFVPKTAVVDSNMGIYIMGVVAGKTQKIAVRKGRALPDMWEIFGELETGMSLLSKPTEETPEGITITKQ